MMMSEFVLSKANKRIYLQKDNPVLIIRRKILNCFKHFDLLFAKQQFISRQNLEEIQLLDPSISNDQCYLSSNMDEVKSLLKPTLILNLIDAIYDRDRFVLCGDTFKKAPINRTSHPIDNHLYIYCKTKSNEFPSVEVRNAVDSILETVVNKNFEYRIIETNENGNLIDNQFNIEVNFRDPLSQLNCWHQVIDAGCISSSISNYVNAPNNKAWLTHINLDLLAMAAFSIQDRKILWSDNQKITDQFKENNITKYSNVINKSLYIRDVQLTKSSSFTEHDFFSIVRDVGNDYVEEVRKIDQFTNVHTSKHTIYYRFSLRNAAKDTPDPVAEDFIAALRSNIKIKLGADLR